MTDEIQDPDLPEQSNEWVRANIMVCGKTGVGKTTLINSIFGDVVGKAGSGRGVTHGINYYLSNDPKLQQVGFYDVEGIELDKTTAEYIKFLDDHIASKWDSPDEDSINIAWICINAKLGKFQEAQICDELLARGIPYIIVLTKSSLFEDGGTEPDQDQLFEYILKQPQASNAVSVIRVCSEIDPTTPVQHGLEELLDLTIDAAPEAVKTSLVIGQELNAKRKTAAARSIINRNVAKAFPQGMVPFAGDVALYRMIRSTTRDLAKIYKVDEELTEKIVPLISMAVSIGHGAITKLVEKGISKLLEKLALKLAEATMKTIAKGIAYPLIVIQGAQASLTYKLYGEALIATFEQGLIHEFEDEISLFSKWVEFYQKMRKDFFF